MPDNQVVQPLLSVEGLRLGFPAAAGARQWPVDGVSFEIQPGECVGLVGESGCGKSLSAATLIGLTRRLPGARLEGRLLWKPRSNRSTNAADRNSMEALDLLTLSEPAMQAIRGSQIGMVFQDPLSCLNPLLKLERQIIEVLKRHGVSGQTDARRSRAQLKQRAIELLEMVGIPRPESRLQQYPHQLSGGLRQRALMAIALAGDPQLLICDEPTTALDVTIQAQVLATLQRLQRERGLTILFITHDLGVVAQLCNRVLVMYAGRIVESAPVRNFFSSPQHPYSRGLLASLPSRQAATVLTRHGAGGEGMAIERAALYSIPGSPPRPSELPAGCRFNPRCSHADERCRSEYPALLGSAVHKCACWRVEELEGQGVVGDAQLTEQRR